MTQRLLLQLSLPLLLVSSSLGVGDREDDGAICKYDSNNNGGSGGGGGENTGGCACGRKVCLKDKQPPARRVEASSSPPPKPQVAVKRMDDSTACLNYFELPMEPDWGCSVEEPLCVDSSGNRPVFGEAGAKCAPYPCHNTKPHPRGTDQGCTPIFPTCVDGLENSPPPGKPGVRCIAYAATAVGGNRNTHTDTAAIPSRGGAWGMNDLGGSEVMAGCRKGNAGSTMGTGLNDGHFSLCNGCPFGGITGTCDVGKLAW